MKNWHEILKTSFTSVEKACDFLELPETLRSKVLLKPNFPFLLPMRLAKKMAKGTLEDPLVRQFLPLKEEQERADGFFKDPVCDTSFQKEGRVLQKYQKRALVVTTGACAMHCRYCFRQNFEYGGEKRFQSELEWLKKEPSIQEVILSGGDPLSLSNDILKYLLDQIALIPHIKRVRFHTRFPIGIPERIDEGFLDLVSESKQEIYIVIHANHPIEIDDEVAVYLKKLKRIGCTLLNQSVLLKGVNDDPAILKELSERLINSGILPYYIHQLDRVFGTFHFEVSEEIGKALVKEIAKELPGYGVPKYVKEEPYQSNKTLISLATSSMQK